MPSGSGRGDSHPDPVVEAHIVEWKRKDVHTQLCKAEDSRSQERRSEGRRRGEGTGTMSWKDQGRFRAWSDPEAQVEYGYAEPEPKESRQKEKCARGCSSAHLLFTFQCITMNTSAEHRGCKVNNSLLLGCSRSPAVRSKKVCER